MADTLPSAWLPAANMQEIGHDLRVLHVRTSVHGLLARTRLFHAFKQEARINNGIEPAAQRAVEPGDTEGTQSLSRFRRRRPKEPFVNAAVRLLEVPAHLDSIALACLIAEVPTMRRV